MIIQLFSAGSMVKRDQFSWASKLRVLASCLILMLAICKTAWADTPVAMGFQNNTGVSDSQIFIQFLGGGAVTGNYVDALSGTTVSLTANTAYSLAQLKNSSLDISQFSGRIYVNYGAYGLSNLGANNGGYTPAASLSTDPNFSTRYQYFETTIAPQTDGSSTYYGDLSYIDFTAMSMSMKLILTNTGSINTSVANTNQISANTQTLVNATAGSATSISAPIFPTGASSVLPNSTFARVISPQFSANGVYHDFSNYLAYLGNTTTGSITTSGTAILAGAQSVNLSGVFVGTGTQPTGSPNTQAQTYSLTGTFNESGGIVLTPNATLSGMGTNIPGISPSSDGTGVGSNYIITITGANLNSQNGIYGNNVQYLVTTPSGSIIESTQGIENDVYGRIVGDLLAGLSFGYVGSTQPFTQTVDTVDATGAITGSVTLTTSLGAMASSAWWASGEAQKGLTYIPVLTGTTVSYIGVTYQDTPSSSGDYFSLAQPNNPDFYDGYSASIGGTTVLTTGYGFPLQDRLGNNLLAYNTIAQAGSKIILTLNADGTAPILTGIWTTTPGGTQTTFDWGTAANWLTNGSGTGGTSFTNVVPGNGATVQFQGTGTGTGNFIVNTTVDRSVNGISFNYAADTFTLTGSTIHLSGDIVNSSHNTQTINNDVELDTNSNIVAAYGNLVLGNMALTGTTMAMFSGNKDTTVNGNISGGGSVYKYGTGVLALNGTNSFSGGLAHQGGTLILGNDSAAGTGTILLGSASGTVTTLQAANGNRTVGNALALTGDVTISGSNNFTFSGTTTLTGTATASYGVNNSVGVNFAGPIGETTPYSSFSKSGTGTMTFSGSSANTYTGTTGVNQGTLVLAKSPNVQAIGGNLVIGTGLGAANSAIVQINADGQISQIAANTGAGILPGININTDGQLNVQSYNIATTSLNMSGGSVIGSGGVISLVGTLSTTGTFVSAGFQFTGVNTAKATVGSGIELSGQQTFQIAKTLGVGPEVTISGPITGDGTVTPISLTKTGSGILALTGSNSLTGNLTVTVTQGVLETTSLSNAVVNLNGGALGSTTTGTVAAAIQLKELYSSNGALLMGLGTGGASDQISVSGSINLNLAAGDITSFLFTNDGFNTGSGTFTLIQKGSQPLGVTLANLQYASVGIAGLTGTFSINGSGNLIFTAQSGVTGTWTGGGGSGNWTTGTNWSGGSVPLTGADLTFTGSTQTNVTLGTNEQTGAITFDASASAFTLSGSTIVLGGNLTNNSTSTQTINSNITLNADRTISASAGALVLTGTIATSNSGALPGTLTFAGSQNISVSGNITDGLLATGTTTAPISGGTVIMAGTGTLTLTGTNTFDGDLIMESGTVVASQAESLGLVANITGTAISASNSLVFDGGRLQLTSSMSFASFRKLHMYETGVIDTNGNNLVINGVISGPGGLTKYGEGTMTLNQSGTLVNTYQGATIIHGGTISLGYAGALGNSTAGVTVDNGGSLYINQTFDMNGETMTLSGTGDNGSGAFHLGSGIDSNWNGTVNLSGSATIETDGNAVLGLTGSVNLNGNVLTLTGSGTTSGIVNVSGIVSGTGGITVGTLTETGTAIVNLTGPNTNLSGTITVQQGILNASQQYSLGSGGSSVVVDAGADLQFTNTGDMTVALTQITLSGTGASAVAGHGAITTTNSASTTVSGSVLLAGNATIGSQSGQLILAGDINTAGNTLTLNSNAGATVLGGNISGTGGIATEGSATAILSGTNSYSGGTSLGVGTSITVEGDNGLGSATGTTTLAASSTLKFSGGITVNQAKITGGGTGVSNNGMFENISGNNTLSGSIDLTGGSTFQADAGKLVISGNIGNASNITIQGGSTGVVSLTGTFTGGGTATVNINNGTLATGSLSNVGIVVGNGVGTAIYSPGDINNIQTVTLATFTTGAGGVVAMDLGASFTSDRISTANPANLSGTSAFFFNNDGATGAATGTYTLFTAGAGNFNTPTDFSFTSNIAGLSGTFIANTSGSLIFQTGTGAWNNSGGNGQWADTTNWQDGYTPSAGSAVSFIVNASGTTTTVDTQTDRSVGGIDFQSGTTAVNVANNTLNLYGQVVNHSAFTQTVSSAVNVIGNTSVNAASSDLALTGAVNFGSTSSLTVTGTHNTSISGGISSSVGVTGTLVKSGTGALHLTGTNTFSGTTLVNGGNFILDGTLGANNSLTINSGATLSGTGTAAGHVTVASGGTISPGHSPGALNTGSQTWSPGGNYNWQILDASGAAGTGYDTLNIAGTLDLTQLSSLNFSINLWSLSSTGPDVNGPALNFNPSSNYEWILASTTSGINGFDSSLFQINTSAINGTGGFSNPFGGTFSIGMNGNQLVLDYIDTAAIPEPSTWVLLALSFAGLAFAGRRKLRKKVASS